MVVVPLLGSSFLPQVATARDYESDAPIEITADSIVYENKRGLYVADGHVRVVQEDRSIEADWVAFSTRTRRGIAAGEVVVLDGEEVLEARFIDFNVDTLQGVCFEARFETGPDGFKVGAEQLRKTGDKAYHVERGVFTTCRCPKEGDREPWKIVAGEGNVRLGGYATAKNTTVDVLGIPTLWLPWLIFPVKTERETGFLLPELGLTSNNGVQIGEPFFWAARDNVNVLVTPRYLQKRGLQTELEVETVYGRRSETELYASYIHDVHEDFDEEVEAARPAYSPNRWAAALESDTFLPAKWRLRAHLLAISDNEYVDHFDQFRNYRHDRFLESRAFLFRHFGSDGRLAATAYATFADDIQYVPRSRDDLDRDRFLLQRMGAGSFDQLPGRSRWLPGVVTSLGAELINFRPLDRPQDDPDFAATIDDAGSFVDLGIDGIPRGPDGDLNPDNPGYDPGPPESAAGAARYFELDGRFQEGELLADYGQRLVLHPRIAYPLRLWDRLDVYPEVGYQETLYYSRNRHFEERGLLTARLDVSSRLYRDFDLPLLPRATHFLQPKLGWALVQQRSQEGNPLFVPRSGVPQRRVRLLQLDNVILDPADRIEAANIVKLGLENRFFLGGGGGRAASLRGEFELSGAYDFSNRDAARLVLDGRTSFATGVASAFALSFDPKRGRVDEGLIDAALRVPPFLRVVSGGLVSARYRYLREIPLFYESVAAGNDRVSQVGASVRIGLGRSWSLGYRSTYSVEQTQLVVNQGFAEYTSKCGCWAFGVDLGDDPERGFEFNFRYTLLGFGGRRGPAFAGRGGISSREFERRR